MFEDIGSNTIYCVLFKILLNNININVIYHSFDKLTFIFENEYYNLIIHYETRKGWIIGSFLL